VQLRLLEVKNPTCLLVKACQGDPAQTISSTGEKFELVRELQVSEARQQETNWSRPVF